MEVKLNMLQAIGIWLMVTGLILNTVIFIFSYYKVASRLKQNEDETEDDEEKDDGKKSFPILRFVFHFRKILKDMLDTEKRESFELVVAFLKWILVTAIAMIAIGLVLFLVGFIF